MKNFYHSTKVTPNYAVSIEKLPDGRGYMVAQHITSHESYANRECELVEVGCNLGRIATRPTLGEAAAVRKEMLKYGPTGEIDAQRPIFANTGD